MDAVQIYKKNILIYGWFTLVRMIQNYEEEGEYERCSQIKRAIDEWNEEWGADLPTRTNDEFYKQCFNELGLTGDTTKENIEEYIKKIEDEIRNKGLW